MRAQSRRAVFLDRDGVIIADVGVITTFGEVVFDPDVALALRALSDAGYLLICVSNQAVVARGMLSEAGVRNIQAEIEAAVAAHGGPVLDGFYFCPHHPRATDPAYRRACGCRKPGAGMLLQAAAEHNIDLARSFMVGDRPSDIVAGTRAGCRTVWAQTGRHNDAPIETATPLPPAKPDHCCQSLGDAARWILEVAA